MPALTGQHIPRVLLVDQLVTTPSVPIWDILIPLIPESLVTYAVKGNVVLCLTKYAMKYSMLNYAQYHENIWGSGGIAPCILNPGIRLRWVASFVLQLFYPQYSFDGRLGGPQSQFELSGNEKKSCWKSNLGHPAHSIAIVLTELPWLCYLCSSELYSHRSSLHSLFHVYVIMKVVNW
jgi:hypothetical protein